MIKFDYIFGAGQPKPKIPMPNIHIRWVHPPEQPVRPSYRAVRKQMLESTSTIKTQIPKSLPDIIELNALFNAQSASGEFLNKLLSALSVEDSWMTERFKTKFSEDLAEAVELLNKNLNTNLQKKDKKMDIKAQLHKLVDGLDEEKYKNNTTLWSIGQGQSVSGLVSSFLTESQKPVEKTLSQKLEDAGFTLLRKRDPIIYGGKKVEITITKDFVTVRKTQSVYDLSSNFLTSSLDNHEQTFADIAYLQQR